MEVYEWQNNMREEYKRHHPALTDAEPSPYADYHKDWRGDNVPVCDGSPEWYQKATEAVIAALMQEGIIAWNGDGVSIIVQMMAAQAQNARA